MKKSLTFAIIISISFSCQHTIEPKKLKSKVEIAEAIEFVVDSLLMDSTFVKELELAPMFSDRIPDSVFRVSLPHFSFLSKQDIDYIIWQQEQLKKTQLIDYLPDKRSIIKDKFIPNGRNMYFELSPPLFSLSGDFFIIHIVTVFQEGKESNWDAEVITCKKAGPFWQYEKYSSPLKYNIPGYYEKTERYPFLPGYPHLKN